MTTHLHNFLLCFFLPIASFLLPTGALAGGSGDIILLFDSSISVRQYRPDIVPNHWLQEFIGKLPDDTNLLIVNFDEGIQHSTKISAQEFKANNSLIPTIKLDGLVSDMAAPIKFLAEYDGPITLAAIISDGEPEISDDLRKYFSKTTLENPEYASLNLQYKQKTAQDLTKNELYTQLSPLYTEKNLQIIQAHLDSLDNKLGEALIFVDLYGKLPFFKQWATSVGGTYLSASDSDQQIHLDTNTAFSKSTQKVPIMTEQAPDQQTSLTQPPTEMQQTAQQTLAPEASAEVTASIASTSQPIPPVEIEVYKADPLSIILSVLITAGVLLTIYFLQYKKRAAQLAAFDADIAAKQADLFSHLESKRSLEQEQADLQSNLHVLEDSLRTVEREKNSVEEEIQLLAKQLESEQASITDKVHDFEQMQKAQIDSELKTHKDELYKSLHEELAQAKEDKLAELEIETAAAFESRKTAIEQEAMKVALKKIEVWEQNETQIRTDKLKEELSHLEQQSKATIQQWEDEAEQRTLALLNSRYREKITGYQNNIKQLNETQNLLKTTINSRKVEFDTLQNKINSQRQLLDKLMASKIEVLVEERRQKEELLWEQTAVEIQQAKEEALIRIHKREDELKQG
nr:hypothetical protein [Desulfobulbaceae bacterium]